MTTSKAKSHAAQAATSALAPFEIARREPGPSDVEIDILFCGVCHSPPRFVIDMASLKNAA